MLTGKRVGLPRLRAGSSFPSFLERRRGAERALASVVATSYLLGVSTGGWRSCRLSRGRGAVEVAGVRDGRRAGRHGGRVPEPAAGPWAVHVLLARRADPEGLRGRPHGERALPDRGPTSMPRGTGRSSASTRPLARRAEPSSPDEDRTRYPGQSFKRPPLRRCWKTPGTSSPPSSNNTTPLHNRLHPCSGWLATARAVARSGARASGHVG